MTADATETATEATPLLKPSRQEAAAIYEETAASTSAYEPGPSTPCPAVVPATALPPDGSYVIVQPGYATGDQFGIAATLVLDPRAHVLITTEAPGPERDSTDRGADLEKFYQESGVASRVKLIEVRSIRDTTAEDLKDGVKELLRIPSETTLSNSQLKKVRRPVTEGTKRIAELFADERTKDDHRALIREAWGVDDQTKDDAIREWLASKGVDPTNKSVVILWSRFSGKKGDIHMEHDTSFTGMNQVVARAVVKNALVILAGDPPMEKEGRSDKYGDIAAAHPGKVFNLTGFWKENPAWCETRNDQLKLYDVLDRNSSSTKHLGFRSGNLEAMALIGHQVNYMEEPGSVGGHRMKQWEETGVGYDRLEVSQPPTRSGKHLRTLLPAESEMQGSSASALAAKEQYKNNKRPDWTPASRAESGIEKPAEVKALDKGFAPADLDKIDTWLTPAPKS